MSLLFTKRVTEATGLPLIDSDDDLYRSAGGVRRDLSGLTLQRAQELSLHKYRSDPLANRIIRIYVSYLAGDGFAISCDNPQVQAIAEEFWTSERNRLDRHHVGFARDWLLMGELFTPVAYDELGNTTTGIIDPLRVERVDRSPTNNLILERVVLHRNVVGEPGPRELVIVRSIPDLLDPEAGLLEGEVFAFLYDRILNSTRGTPFLLPILDFLDAYDQTLWEHLERVKALRAFFWDVEVDGGATEVAEAQKAWGTAPPRSGSVRFRTPALRVKAESPQLGGYEDVNSLRYFLRHISSGAGLAPHWLSEPEDANRSTAEIMDSPVLRSLVDTQNEWKANVEDLIRFAVDRKVAAGMLPRLVPRFTETGQETDEIVPARDAVEIVVPAIRSDDIVEAAGALAQVASAFIQADTIGILPRETMALVMNRLLPALGVPADALPSPGDENSLEQTQQALADLEAEARRVAGGGRFSDLVR